MFCSVNAHIGYEEFGAKDDLEALMYTVIFAGTGSLPWMAKSWEAIIT
jgi:hypothetical protein